MTQNEFVQENNNDQSPKNKEADPVLTKAVKDATNSETLAETFRPRNIKQVFEQVRKQIKRTLKRSEQFNSLMGYVSYESDGSTDEEKRLFQGIVSYTRDLLGNLIGTNLQPDECIDVFAPGKGLEPEKSRLSIRSSREDSDYGRKDLVIGQYFLYRTKEEKREENQDNPILPYLDTLSADYKDLLINYQTHRIDYENDKVVSKAKRYTMSDVLKYVSNKNSHTPEDPTLTKQLESIIEDLFNYTSKDIKGNMMSLKETGDFSPYYSATVPTGFLYLGDKLVGAVKVMSYTPEEVSAWVEELDKVWYADKEATEIMQMNIETKDKIFYKFLNIAGFTRNGLHILMPNGPHAGKEMGVSIGGMRKYIHFTRRQEMVDYIDPETAEVIREPDKQNYPIILRFPNDVKLEDLGKLGQLMKRDGIDNVIIQIIPCSSAELNILGNAVFKGRYNKQMLEESGLDSELAEKLLDKKAWVE